MPNYFYVQQIGGVSDWKPIPSSAKEVFLRENKPEFITVLAVSKLVDELPPEERMKLSYEGPMYFDFDGPDITLVLTKVNEFLDKLAELSLDLTAISCFATGGKGFHIEIPVACWLEKPSKSGIQCLPVIFREMALELCVDTLDLRVYSQGRGRMWRVPNNQRKNGLHKVPVTEQDIRGMTAATYAEIASKPRGTIPRTQPHLCVDLAILYAKSVQKVDEKLKARSKFKKTPNDKQRAHSISIEMMMAGHGIKEGAGFHDLALQIAVAASTAGLTEQKMLEECEGLIDNHESSGSRYNTPAKRKAELSRMFAYCDDNPCYTFSVGAIKSLLNHAAPDLDGMAATKEEIEEGIAEAKEALTTAESNAEAAPDEFEDTSAGITLNKFGVYLDTDGGKKRICAVSFKDIHLLIATETGQLSAYEADVLVNGRATGRQTMEIDTFSSVQMFNRFAARLGHALQGTEPNIRGLMMRFVELAKKKGRMRYIAKREGLDLVNIPNHEDLNLRQPFMVWADTRGVILDPRVEGSKVDMSFQGYPTPSGVFKADLADAPALAEWLESPANKDDLKETLYNLFTCQRAEVIGKLLGWYTSAVYRMLFHKAYGQFPILHVNGSAGAGKSAMNKGFMSLFYYNQEPKMLTPGSTLFAVQQHMAGSASIPLILDEYKPQEMASELHSKYKLLIRDAYNCRAISKGGGTRESDDYRSLHQTELAAPLVVIAEAAEEEAAVSERIVLVTFVKPASSVATSWALRFQNWSRNGKHLTMLGQWLVAQALKTSSVDKLREEFDPLYQEAREKYMLFAADLDKGLDLATLSNKQNAKERSVFNFTVARFGLSKFRGLIESIYGTEEFYSKFEEMEAGIYTRMTDLQGSTQPEWAKVLNMMSTMSHYIDGDLASPLQGGKDYAFVSVGGKDCIELSMRSSYLKYRSFCRQTNSKPLFAGDQSFLQAIKDCPAFVSMGLGRELQVPGVYCFDLQELVRLNVESFKEGR